MTDKDFGSNRQGDLPTEGQPISNARLAAELQAVALAIRIGGLEGIRNGSVRMRTASAVGTDGEAEREPKNLPTNGDSQ